MMEWTEFLVYVTIGGLLKAGHTEAKMRTLLRPLKMNKSHIYCVKKLFKETGDVFYRPGDG